MLPPFQDHVAPETTGTSVVNSAEQLLLSADFLREEEW
jgi:hypothetical protein